LGNILPKLLQQNANAINTGDIINAFAATVRKLSDGSSPKLKALQIPPPASSLKGQQIDDKGTPKTAGDLQLTAAGGAVSFLTDLSNVLGDSKLADQVDKIGNGCIDIARSIAQFSDITAKLGGSGGYLLGGILLSGNIFSAALDIFSAFGGGPSPNEIIIKELQGISTQIDTLYSVMNRRFDEIDWKLDTIYR